MAIHEKDVTSKLEQSSEKATDTKVESWVGLL